MSGPVLSHLWTKVHEFVGQCRRPFVLLNAFADCLCHISLRIYSPLSVEVVEKPNKSKSFLAPNFLPGGKTPTVLQQIVRFTVRRLAKFGWVLFAVTYRVDLATCSKNQSSPVRFTFNSYRDACSSTVILWLEVHNYIVMCSLQLVSPVSVRKLEWLAFRVHCVVLSQSTRVTDRRTDGRTDGQNYAPKTVAR